MWQILSGTRQKLHKSHSYVQIHFHRIPYCLKVSRIGQLLGHAWIFHNPPTSFYTKTIYVFYTNCFLLPQVLFLFQINRCSCTLIIVIHILFSIRLLIEYTLLWHKHVDLCSSIMSGKAIYNARKLQATFLA